jgi:hypothetical protein
MAKNVVSDRVVDFYTTDARLFKCVKNSPYCADFAMTDTEAGREDVDGEVLFYLRGVRFNGLKECVDLLTAWDTEYEIRDIASGDFVAGRQLKTGYHEINEFNGPLGREMWFAA